MSDTFAYLVTLSIIFGVFPWVMTWLIGNVIYRWQVRGLQQPAVLHRRKRSRRVEIEEDTHEFDYLFKGRD